MCYSAMVVQDARRIGREYGADVDLGQVLDELRKRRRDANRMFTKAFEAGFRRPGSGIEAAIAEEISAYEAERATALEAGLFRQRKRLADAERSLAARETRKALEERRIATDKVAWHLAKLAALRRTEPRDDDGRIFPMWYAPVILDVAGRRMIRAMRYHLRPAGKPASLDRRFPGLYNARRDNLQGFWKNNFGAKHGVVVATGFYENVSAHRVEGRELAPGEKERNVVLKFEPKPRTEMLLACLWDRWTAPGEPDLYSFALITDEPPPEVAAAGHDRCVIPLKRENLDRWLTPSGRSPDELLAILDDRERPYYEHQLAQAA